MFCFPLKIKSFGLQARRMHLTMMPTLFFQTLTIKGCFLQSFSNFLLWTFDEHLGKSLWINANHFCLQLSEVLDSQGHPHSAFCKFFSSWILPNCLNSSPTFFLLIPMRLSLEISISPCRYLSLISGLVALLSQQSDSTDRTKLRDGQSTDEIAEFGVPEIISLLVNMRCPILSRFQ